MSRIIHSIMLVAIAGVVSTTAFCLAFDDVELANADFVGRLPGSHRKSSLYACEYERNPEAEPEVDHDEGIRYVKKEIHTKGPNRAKLTWECEGHLRYFIIKIKFEVEGGETRSFQTTGDDGLFPVSMTWKQIFNSSGFFYVGDERELYTFIKQHWGKELSWQVAPFSPEQYTTRLRAIAGDVVMIENEESPHHGRFGTFIKKQGNKKGCVVKFSERKDSNGNLNDLSVVLAKDLWIQSGLDHHDMVKIKKLEVEHHKKYNGKVFRIIGHDARTRTWKVTNHTNTTTLYVQRFHLQKVYGYDWYKWTNELRQDCDDKLWAMQKQYDFISGEMANLDKKLATYKKKNKALRKKIKQLETQTTPVQNYA